MHTGPHKLLVAGETAENDSTTLGVDIAQLDRPAGHRRVGIENPHARRVACLEKARQRHGKCPNRNRIAHDNTHLDILPGRQLAVGTPLESQLQPIQLVAVGPGSKAREREGHSLIDTRQKKRTNSPRCR